MRNFRKIKRHVKGMRMKISYHSGEWETYEDADSSISALKKPAKTWLFAVPSHKLSVQATFFIFWGDSK